MHSFRQRREEAIRWWSERSDLNRPFILQKQDEMRKQEEGGKVSRMKEKVSRKGMVIVSRKGMVIVSNQSDVRRLKEGIKECMSRRGHFHFQVESAWQEKTRNQAGIFALQANFCQVFTLTFVTCFFLSNKFSR